MAWYLNAALTNFRNAVNARYTHRDKASDGTIGNLAHQATSSDHNPDADGSVDAWDMDVELNGVGKAFGYDLELVIAAALKHESIQYVIYNRRITSRSMPGGLGTWHPYDGSNPHDKHVHFNTRESHDDSTAPWVIGKPMEVKMLDLAGKLPELKQGMSDPVPGGGSMVARLQSLLNVHFVTDLKVDGNYGPATASYVKQFNAKFKRTVDGKTVDAVTWRVLIGLV